MAAGADSAHKSTSEQLLPGVQQLYDGVTGMQSQVESGIGQLSGGTSQLKGGIEAAAAGRLSYLPVLKPLEQAREI